MTPATVFRLTFREEQFEELSGLLARTDVESAAFLRCGVSTGQRVTRLLVRAVEPVAERHYAERTLEALSILSGAFAPVIARARRHNEVFVLVHTHPHGPAGFSRRDDREEQKLLGVLQRRLPGRPFGSLVLTEGGELVGRVWLPSGAIVPLERLSVVGRRLRIMTDVGNDGGTTPFFDRQVRAFGQEAQALLSKLEVGIVGAGGTGSAVFDQLLRLGVGRLLVVDPDRFDPTNINRVVNSRLSDAGQPKVTIPARTAWETGLTVSVEPAEGSILDPEVVRLLCACDVVFGCTDRELPRLILDRLARRYLIPVFDVGVRIHSTAGVIQSVWARCTTLFPGAACMLCRGRITPDGVRAESMEPEERQRLAGEGYAPELGEPAPAVGPFTTAIASIAMSRFLHLVTGFMQERDNTETLIRLDAMEIRSNQSPPTAECDCADGSTWGRGDEDPLLGLVWRPRTGS